jgi:hypothetical protein
MRRPTHANPTVGRSLALTATAIVLIGVLVGCTGGDGDGGDDRGGEAGSRPSNPEQTQSVVSARDLRASVLQLRHEEGTATIHLRLTNTGSKPVEVASVRLGGPSLTSGEATPVVDEARMIESGQLMTAPGAYEPPRCDAAGQPSMLTVTLASGETLEVPMDADGQQLVDWLVARDCGLARIEESVRIRFLPDWRIRTVAGSRAMVGTLALDRRRNGSRELEVVGVRGSVLLDFALLRPRQSYTLRTGVDAARLPVALVPAGRCDGHALGQSRQTFLLSVFVQLRGQAEQRLILSPTLPVQDRVLALVSRACGV